MCVKGREREERGKREDFCNSEDISLGRKGGREGGREEGKYCIIGLTSSQQRDAEMETRTFAGEGSIREGLGGTDGLCQDDSGEGGGTGL